MWKRIAKPPSSIDGVQNRYESREESTAPNKKNGKAVLCRSQFSYRMLVF
jgi:hypothetical protein